MGGHESKVKSTVEPFNYYNFAFQDMPPCPAPNEDGSNFDQVAACLQHQEEMHGLRLFLVATDGNKDFKIDEKELRSVDSNGNNRLDDAELVNLHKKFEKIVGQQYLLFPQHANVVVDFLKKRAPSLYHAVFKTEVRFIRWTV